MADVVYLGAIWAAVLYFEETRNGRFVVFLAAASGIFMTVGWIAGPSNPIRIGLAVAIVVGGAFAEQIGLGSIRGKELGYWRILRRMRATAFDEATTDVIEGLGRLLDDSIEGVSPEWLAAARLLRRATLRRAGNGTRSPAPMVPAGLYEVAGRAFLEDARGHRVLLHRSTVQAWHEDVAIRAFFDDYRDLIPSAANIDRPMIALGPWSTSAARTIDQLEAFHVRDPSVDEIKSELVQLLRRELSIWTGDHSIAARRQYDIASKALFARWSRLEEAHGLLFASKPAM